MSRRHQIVIPEGLHRQLLRHLFPGDRDEHGAILRFGVMKSDRFTRLLVRDLVLAKDGKDFVPGARGYRALTGSFVTEGIRSCRDEQLGYLSIHNHVGGGHRVSFSGDDMASHERGYPSLLQISQRPVGALVFSQNAVAGDIWWPGGTRSVIDELVVVGRRVERFYPAPPPQPSRGSGLYDRQARLFGDAGQEILGRLKVGVIGAGGAGALILQYLGRLGVGHLVAVDPDRVELSNLPRIPGATRWHARYPLVAPSSPEWLQRLGRRLATPKVRLARRLARKANGAIIFEPIRGDIVEDQIARRLRDCDFLFLAADTFRARLVFNALVHQYLIPGVQVGAKVPVEAESGDVGDVFTVTRPVLPGSGCLWCNGLIPPGRLQEEAATAEERRAANYVGDGEVEAPSVITLNAIASSLAVNTMLFSMTGLTDLTARLDYIRYSPRARVHRNVEPRRDANCSECGAIQSSRLAHGDGRALPTR